MLIQPVVLTMPRRDPQQVETIRAVFSGDPGFAEPLVYRDALGVGAAVATREAIALAGAGGLHVLFLEDDVLVDHEAPARIAATTFPSNVAAISFCDMREVAEFSPSGLYVLNPMGSDGRGWWGNQALLLHRDIVTMCARENWFGPEIESSLGIHVHKETYGDNGRNCSDIRLSLLIELHGGERNKYAVHVPSLFRHVGYESVCFPGRGLGERETRNWIADRRRFNVDAIIGAELTS
ncbi:MAG: hypothetical protein WCP26_00390 [Actinomycetes bacterium]